MKDWITNQTQRQLDFSTEFLEQTQKTLISINQEHQLALAFKVFLDKDKWLDEGSVTVEIYSQKNTQGKPSKNKWDMTDRYIHSIHDKTPQDQLSPLMKSGLLTNSWFFLLDRIRGYNATLWVSSASTAFVEEDNNAEYAEKKYLSTHLGFNETLPDASNSLNSKKNRKTSF